MVEEIRTKLTSSKTNVLYDWLPEMMYDPIFLMPRGEKEHELAKFLNNKTEHLNCSG